jgi:hypothetical protein
MAESVELQVWVKVGNRSRIRMLKSVHIGEPSAVVEDILLGSAGPLSDWLVDYDQREGFEGDYEAAAARAKNLEDY